MGQDGTNESRCPLGPYHHSPEQLSVRQAVQQPPAQGRPRVPPLHRPFLEQAQQSAAGGAGCSDGTGWYGLTEVVSPEQGEQLLHHRGGGGREGEGMGDGGAHAGCGNSTGRLAEYVSPEKQGKHHQGEGKRVMK